MREWIERMMLALGWMPTERERALEDALEKVRSSHGEDRAALQAFRREAMKATASWEKAEARVREVEAELAEITKLFGTRRQLQRDMMNRKLLNMNEQAERITR